jgi:hypothetical protein
MAEEITIIQITMKDGNLQIHINSQDAIQLWGLAKVIEKRADDIHRLGMAMANAETKKPRIVLPS